MHSGVTFRHASITHVIKLANQNERHLQTRQDVANQNELRLSPLAFIIFKSLKDHDWKFCHRKICYESHFKSESFCQPFKGFYFCFPVYFCISIMLFGPTGMFFFRSTLSSHLERWAHHHIVSSVSSSENESMLGSGCWVMALNDIIIKANNLTHPFGKIKRERRIVNISYWLVWIHFSGNWCFLWVAELPCSAFYCNARSLQRLASHLTTSKKRTIIPLHQRSTLCIVQLIGGAPLCEGACLCGFFICSPAQAA